MYVPVSTHSEYLGAEPMTSGDDEGKGEEEIDGEDHLEPLPSDVSPT